jgi:hypothetical protein
MSRFLWNHELISYGRAVEVSNPDGTVRQATPVKYDGKLVGYVCRAEIARDGWGYRSEGDTGVWQVGNETRADAADHLLSHRSPSAAWLS